MIKLKSIPKSYIEIIITIILYFILLAISCFLVKEHFVISDVSLSTIGLCISTVIGVLTGIVVSFVLVILQLSRQERSQSFWRWRNALHQFEDSFDTNLETLSEIYKDVIKLTFESSEVSLVSPMPRKRLKELFDAINRKSTEITTELQNVKKPSSEQVTKAKAYRDITNYFVLLATANFEHTASHYLYKRILNLRGLLYRLFVILIISILAVVMGNTTSSTGISDTFNTPFVVILIIWITYLFTNLGTEIKKLSLLEEEFQRQEIEFKQ